MTLSPHLLAFIAIFILSAMDAMIKGMSDEFGTLQIVLMRFLAGALVIAAIFAWRFPGAPNRETVRVNGLRGFLVVFTALSFFYGLSTLPLRRHWRCPSCRHLYRHAWRRAPEGDRRATDHLRPCPWHARHGGDGLWPSNGRSRPRPVLGIAAAIASAFSYGLAIVLLRARATRDPVVTIVLIQHVVPALIVGALATVVWLLLTPGMAAIPHALSCAPSHFPMPAWRSCSGSAVRSAISCLPWPSRAPRRQALLRSTIPP